MKLTGKVAIVTGSARNIGKDIASRLASEGATIVVADFDDKLGPVTAAELGNGSIFVKIDISNAEDRKNLISKCVETFGKIDILVNNAGILYHNTLDNMTEESWDRTMNINLKGAAFLTREVAAVMKEAGYGRIINTSSMLSKVHYFDTSEYAVSKAGVASLTEQAATEYARYGITVNAIAPGYIFTDMTRKELSQPVIHEKICKRIPMRRIGETSDIGAAVLFFAGDDSSYITGQTLLIDGGYTLI